MGVTAFGAPSRGSAVASLTVGLGRAAVVAAVGLTTLAAGETQSPDTLALEAGAEMERKLLVILRNADTEAPDTRLTPLPVPQINAFLEFQGASQLPTGITEPALHIGDARMVSAEATIDLDLIRQQRARGWLDPLQYLAGRLPVTAAGTIRSGAGSAQLDVHSVTVAGIPVPAAVLYELVSYFTRTADHPEGTRLDQPIPLPYRIIELRLSPGQAVVVQ